MEVPFTVEQVHRLDQMAHLEGVAPEHLVRDAALQLLEADERFRAGVCRGLEQANQGQFLEETEMDARLARMLGHE